MSLHRSLFTWFTLLVFFVLLVLRLDNRTQWNWFVVFIPLWIFNSVLFIYSTFYVVSVWQSRTEYRRPNFSMTVFPILSAVCKMAFEIMLCLKLESPSLGLKSVHVLAPLFVILPIAALGLLNTLLYNY